MCSLRTILKICANKTLGRARDPRANEDRELIRRARRDGREARGNEKLSYYFLNIDTCLCLFPQGYAFLLSSRLDSAVKRCSSEVLKLSFQRSCSVKGLASRD